MAERKRIGVPISGIDTSTPDHSVTDGKCAELHNLRYTGGAWRNVKGFENKTIPELNVTGLSNITIVYQVPADEDRAYICTAIREDETILIRLIYNDTSYTWEYQTIMVLNTEHAYQYAHFGRMLIVSDNTSLDLLQFLFDGTSYSMYVDKDIKISMSLKIPEFKSSATDQDGLPYNKHADVAFENGYISNTVIDTKDNSFIFASQQHAPAGSAFDKPNLFRGEFLAVAVMRDATGDTIGISNFCLFNTVNELNNMRKYKYGIDLNPTVVKAEDGAAIRIRQQTNISSTASLDVWFKNIATHFFVCSAVAQIDIENVNDTVKSVSIYATRLHNLFEQKGEAFADNSVDLFKETLYLMEDIDISKFKDENNTLSYSKNINYTDFENIINNTEYEAIQVSTEIWGNVAKEYNNRIILKDVATKIQLNSLSEFLPIKESTSQELPTKIIGTYINNNNTHAAASNLRSGYVFDTSYLTYISLPYHYDAIWFTKSDDTATHSYKLNYSALLNTSYFYLLDAIFSNPDRFNLYTNAEGTQVGVNIAKQKYKNIFEAEQYNRPVPSNYKPYVAVADNSRVQVSSENNSYTFPFNNSYRIGSTENEIIAVNSGAIEMSDSKFGEFPLYVFTKEGIFAMQSGKETLYSAIIPINYDVAINPCTLAVNGAVLYFTEKGLHALTNQGSQLLSSPIHTNENRIPSWMRTSEMIYLPEWNEVMCTDLANNKAYVFSLDNKVWSTRDIPDGYILNNDELVATNHLNIYNLRNEAESLNNNIMSMLESNATTFSLMRSASPTSYIWDSEWGILKRSGDEDRRIIMYNSSGQYEKQVYVYRPTLPKKSLTQYDFKSSIYAKIAPDFNPINFVFIVADDLSNYGDKPFDVNNEPLFSKVNVFTPEGELFATLQNEDNPGNNIYINANIYYDSLISNSNSYGISFTPDNYDSNQGRIRIYPYGYDSVNPEQEFTEVLEWYEQRKKENLVFVTKELRFDKDDSSLYYAFNNPLDETGEYGRPMVVCLYDNIDSIDAFLCEQTDSGVETNYFEDMVFLLEDNSNEGGEDDNTGGGTGGDNTGEDDNTGGSNISTNTIRIVTRPIKLGSMELKRAETMIVRFECNTQQTLKVKVEGSIDTQNWAVLRNIETTTNKDVLIRRTPFSVKYLRFTIEGDFNDDIRILAFELEYYERMRHRMR